MSRPFSSPDVFRAVADPTRRGILDLLRKRDLQPAEISQAFKVSRPTLSFHLRVLRESGLVRTSRRGRSLIYAANRSALRPVDAWIKSQQPG